jgi:hypothetical protein
MLNDDFINLSPQDKLKTYELFNDPSNLFTKEIQIDDFKAQDASVIEDPVNAAYEDDALKKLNKSKVKNDELLLKMQTLMTPTQTYPPIATDNNPFPYLRKPVIDLSKYDTDQTAQSILKQIDASEYNESDKKYLKLLGARESDFRLTAGKGQYRGIYQFNKDSLKAVGIKMEDYLSSPKLQFEAALKYRDSNVKELGDYQKYIGTVKDGILVTKNGLGAMAHLLGPGTVKDYFDGTKKTKLAQNGFKDGNGTHIQEYLKIFA